MAKTKIRATQLSASMPSDSQGAAAAGGLTVGDLSGVLDHMASSIKRIHGGTTFTEAAAGVFGHTLKSDTTNTDALGTAGVTWSDLFLGDGAVINLGEDQDVTLTHVADTGVTLAGAHANGTNLRINNTADDGDSRVEFQLDGTTKWSVGVEDGDSDKFVIEDAAGALGADPAFEILADKSAKFYGGLTATTSFTIGSASLTEAELEMLDGITGGAGAASKALVLDGSADVASGLRNLTASGFITAGSELRIGNAQITETELEMLDGITPGAGLASKALVLDASADVASGLRDLTASRNIIAGNELRIGNAQIAEAELEMLDGITGGAGAANKALVLDGNADVASGLRNVTASGVVTAAGFTIGSAVIAEAELEMIDGITPGAGLASKALVLDAQADVASGLRDLATSRDVTVGRNLVVAGNLDINGTTTTIDTTNLSVEDSIIALGVSGSNGAYSATGDRGILFTRGTLPSAQAGLHYDGARFKFTLSPTGPTSGSFAAPIGFGKVMVDRVEFKAATDNITMGTHMAIATNSGDIILDPGGNNVVPGGDSQDDLGADGTAWRTLFVDDIDLNGVGRIDFDADGDTSIRAISDDVLGFEVGGADKLRLEANMLQPETSSGLDLGSPAKTWKDLYIGDAREIKFGNDQDVILTHVADTGLRLNAAMQLQFRDATEYIQSDANGDMMVRAATTVNLNVNGTDELSVTAAAATFGGHIAIPNSGQIGCAADPDLLVLANQSVTLAANASLTYKGAAVTATGAELNLLGGGASNGGSIAIADADGIFVNDGGTSKLQPALDLIKYVHAAVVKETVAIAADQASDVDVTFVGPNIWEGSYQSGNESYREIYVNGQLMREGSGSGTDNDFYPGSNLKKVKFEFPLVVGDLVTLILRKNGVLG